MSPPGRAKGEYRSAQREGSPVTPFRNIPMFLPPRSCARVALMAAVAVLTAPGCADKPSKDEQEAARNTFACTLSGERLVVRFDSGEARLLMPGGERVVLYQIPVASGVRFSNGTLELRGKGVDLQLQTHSGVTPLVDCQPYVLPKAPS
jgi:membrane-bound inhibitor of C-type lysozyme